MLSCPVRVEVACGLEDEVTDLFRTYRGSLLRYLTWMGLPAPDSEEIVQEVFLSLFAHLRAGRSRDNLRGWIFRVAHNQGLKQRTRVQRSELKIEPEEWDRFVHPAPGPEEALQLQQRRMRLLACLRAMPTQDRSCIQLRAEGLRYREIAEVLGMSLGGVAAAMSRALSKLILVNAR